MRPNHKLGNFKHLLETHPQCKIWYNPQEPNREYVIFKTIKMNSLLYRDEWLFLLTFPLSVNCFVLFFLFFFIPVKSVDVKVDILILSFGEIQEANMVSFGVGMFVYILTVEVFLAISFHSLVKIYPFWIWLKYIANKPGGSQKIEGEAFKKQITIKVPKNKGYFVNARETHFDVLSKLLFRLLEWNFLPDV